MFQKKLLAAAAIAALAGIIAMSVIFENKKNNISEKGIFIMDTYCTITLEGEKIQDVSELLYNLNNEFDSFDENSETAHINSGLPIDKNTFTGKLILESISLQEKYKGGVDITSGSLTYLWDISGESPRVPTEQELKGILPTIGLKHIHVDSDSIMLDPGTKLDFGAVAKGYALDEVKSLLDKTNTSYGIISMTSSMLLYGEKENGEPFKIAVRGSGENEIIGTIETSSCFVSSSGSYERYFTDDNGTIYSHILDPETGYPAETDLVSVTVLCQSGIMSDYLSTMIFMGGGGNIEKHLHSSEYKIAAADKNGNLYLSDGLIFKKT